MVNQFIMCTHLLNLTLFDYDDLVCIADQVKLMGDDNRGLTFHQITQRLQHKVR